MERKIVLEVEELEERIAPHFTLGGGHSMVEGAGNHGPTPWTLHLDLPNGESHDMPQAATDGLLRAAQGGN